MSTYFYKSKTLPELVFVEGEEFLAELHEGGDALGLPKNV